MALPLRTDTYVALVRWCGGGGFLAEGQRIHAHLLRHDRDSNNNKKRSSSCTYLHNLVIHMYAKCGSLGNARSAFDAIALKDKDTFSWNAIISAYAQTGHPQEALNLFSLMIKEKTAAAFAVAAVTTSETCSNPDPCTYLSVLSSCASVGDLRMGRTVHRTLSNSGLLGSFSALNTALVNMYGKCGDVEAAQSVFDGIQNPDVFLYTAMMSAYARNGFAGNALQIFRQMISQGIKPDRMAFITALDACTKSSSLEHGEAIHKSIISVGTHVDVSVSNALLYMYGKCGSLEQARSIFDRMKQRDVVSWNAMIATYAQIGHGEDALQIFSQMISLGVMPNMVTFVSALDACAIAKSLQSGRFVHELATEACLLEPDTPLKASLINMYSKCGSLKDARSVFDGTHRHSLDSWNSMITGYAQNGHGKEALELYKQMESEGVKPDLITYLAILDACASLASLEDGRAIHKRLSIASGTLGSDISLKNSLLNMYGKCKSLEDAKAIFDQVERRNIVSWNTMIGAYIQNRDNEAALELFQKMDTEGVAPDRITFLAILKACADHTSLDNGRMIHKRMIDTGFELDVTMENALLNMYGKCGSLDDACVVFGGICHRHVVSWNAMIAVCARNGHNAQSLQLLQQLAVEGVKPTKATFLSVFSACSHAGLWYEGWEHFVMMTEEYGMTPLLEHYLSMIDLLGRAGWSIETEDLVRNMPIQPDAIAWKTLLGLYEVGS